MLKSITRLGLGLLLALSMAAPGLVSASSHGTYTPPDCDDLLPGTALEAGTCLPEAGTTRFGLQNLDSVSGILLFVLNVLLMLVGVIAIIFVVIGGYRYITSAGGDTAEAKSTILNALIGLAIVLLAFALVRIVANLVTNSAI